MVDKTLAAVLGHTDFNTLGASRTDALVSANQGAVELFTTESIAPEQLLLSLNEHLPNDIRALGVEEVNADFNIIRHSKIKEYLYLFSFGAKNHPFAAPFMTYMQEALDIPKMQEGAQLFEGLHNFQRYCSKAADKVAFTREITCCQIRKNTLYTASFFPEQSYMLQVRGTGFLRHQVRLMMGALFDLGKGKITLEDISHSLQGGNLPPISYMAPASGLILQNISFIE